MVQFCCEFFFAVLLAVTASASTSESSSESGVRRLRPQGRQRQLLREHAMREGAELLGMRGKNVRNLLLPSALSKQ